MSATDSNANAKSRAEEFQHSVQHFTEVDLRLYELRKLYPLSDWAALGGSTEEYIFEIRDLTEERERCIHNLEQLGKSRQDLEELSRQLRKQSDESSIRDLHQLAGTSSPHATAATSEPQQKSRAAKAKLTRREENIWEVIQRGVEGMQYCRELHDKALRPRKAWIDRGCPGTYPVAYKDPYWRQRINDEKYKIRHKAELAGE